jgi:hypothetical protein
MSQNLKCGEVFPLSEDAFHFLGLKTQDIKKAFINMSLNREKCAKTWRHLKVLSSENLGVSKVVSIDRFGSRIRALDILILF